LSELPDGIPPATLRPPRDSAAAIVFRHGEGGRLEFLLGVRSRESRFMPGHLAFPGGAVDPVDRPDEPGAFLRCAVREIAEETSLELDPSRLLPAGDRITPPLFPLRFRTRFFVAQSSATEAPDPPTPEIESLRFATPSEVIKEWETGQSRVPPPTLALLRALCDVNHDAPENLIAERAAAANAQEERAPRIEIHPGIWVLPLSTATMPPATHTNAWMPGGERFIVIDPGSTDRLEQRRLEEVVERRRRTGAVLDSVVISHHHQDHVGGALATARNLGVPLRAHPQVLGLFESPGIERLPINDGELLDLGGLQLEALHTPGHAPGHLAFLLRERKMLLAGDLVSGISTILIDPEGGDMGDYLASLRRVRELGCSILLPSHGPPLPGKAIGRLLEHRAEREAKILEEVRAPRSSLEEIAKVTYLDVPQMPAALTERQTASHLRLLEAQGRVRRTDEAGNGWAPA